MDLSLLFSPLTIGNKQLSNRIVMPPMLTLRKLASEGSVDWYGQRAQGGASMIIVEGTPVARFDSELTPEILRPLVKRIHDGGSLAAIQLIPVSIDRQSISPSDINEREIVDIIARFQRAATVCKNAGFDGLEVHGAHAYVLNQFFSPVRNNRTDSFGGELKKRMRLALEIVAALRSACEDDTLILYRHTPEGEGYGIRESCLLAEALADAGVDLLDLSPSSRELPGDQAAPFTALGLPTIAVGQLHYVERALDVLANARAHLVAIGRGLIADPEWPRKVKEGRFSEIVECIACNKGCHENLRKGIPVRCVKWGA